MLGVNLEDETVIVGIEPDSAAQAAGLKEGDRIVKLGDKKVKTQEELRAAIQASPKETTVTYVRDGKEHTVKVTFPR
jgi:S1-C subfamily serine protease